ncbi:hypothetical protein [Coralloluteibacterium thermophilus]|uniref:Uncharacterized protein n=1 Tax=Coralloluteibacterium thermophilum TaxID=2707049 RepID=A0ABV9NI28_9GAMM
MNLRAENFRFVMRAGQVEWVSPAELRESDIDCTDMDDDEFVELVRKHNPQPPPPMPVAPCTQTGD